MNGQPNEGLTRPLVNASLVYLTSGPLVVYPTSSVAIEESGEHIKTLYQAMPATQSN